MCAAMLATLAMVGTSCSGIELDDAGDEPATDTLELVASGDADADTGALPESIPARTFLGTPFSGDTLANLDVGGVAHTSVGYRFVAERSGVVATVRPFIVVNTSRLGYAAGTGGIVQVSLVADDGTGLPDLDHVLARGQIEMALVDGHLPPPADTDQKRAQNYSAIKLGGQPVIAGQTYHVVFEQIDPDPVNNYVGLDLLYQLNTELGPRPPISDWGVTVNNDDDPWREFTHRFGEELYTPIMSIAMADGYIFGNGYIEAFPEEHSYRPVDEAASIQVAFSPEEDFTASQWWIRALRTEDEGVLKAHLQGSDGTDEVVEVPAIDFSTGEMRWLSMPWARTFSADVNYTLTLSGEQGGTFALHPLREGEVYNYEAGSYFAGVSRPSDGNGGYAGWHKELSDLSFTNADIMMAWTS